MNKTNFLNLLLENKILLKQFVECMNEDEINRRIKDYWTIYEHVEHLVITQILLLKRMEQFINEDNPLIVPYIPEDKPKTETVKKSITKLVEKYSVFREKQIQLIKKAKSNVWTKTGSHGEYNRYTFEILIRHTILHDQWHMLRMEELWIMKEQYINELK